MKYQNLILPSLLITAFSGCALEEPDFCPLDPDKTKPGICGCDIPESDIDTDGDGSIDCKDECPNNPEKSKVGFCGCNMLDDDTNQNGLIDCFEICPSDTLKVDKLPGKCGCDTEDTDTDDDGTPDCEDTCPEDPNKTEAGICGCGTPDTDSDGDETYDCQDACPNDPNKTKLGVCGCGTPETGDSDNDGVDDCKDACPNDPKKTETGECGCGVADEDINENGILDCQELCPEGSLKADQLPGACGCYAEDSEENLKDSDGDGIINCNDKCPTNRCYFNEECPAEPWDKYENKFQIRSACDFEVLRNMQSPPNIISIENDINLGVLAQIENNICTLNWEPIQLKKETTIYGKDKLISASRGNIRCSLTNALFAKIEENTSISNLSLDYDISASGRAMLANSATLDYTENPSQILNVTYKGSIKTDTQNSVGGLIGKLTSTKNILNSCNNKKLILENTYANGISIYATKANDVGGLIGHAECLDYSLSTNPHIVDTIQGQNNVGGFVGYWGKYDFKPKKAFYIQSNEISGKDNVGGMIGFIEPSSKLISQNISNIIHQAQQIKGKSYIGGLIGKVEGPINLNHITNEIQTVHGEQKIGGILGGYDSKILPSIEFSSIRNQIQTMKGASTIGGIIGETQSISKLSSIHNDIEIIQGGINIGGIIGSSAYSSRLNNIISKTNEILGTTAVGGLYGKALTLTLDSVDAEISILKGKTNVGGLIGSASGVTIKNTASRANVQIQEDAEKDVGGMIGKVSGALNITGTVSAASLSQNIDGTQSPSQSYLVSGSYAIKTDSETGAESPNLTTQNAYWLKRYASFAITTDDKIDNYFNGFAPDQTPSTVEKLKTSSGKFWKVTSFNINGIPVSVPQIVPTLDLPD